MRILSLIISSVFHPTFIPLIGFLLLYSFSGYALYLPEDIFWFSILVIVQFTILIPIGLVYFLYWRKIISSIELSNQKERPLPLILTLISYTIAFLLFRYLQYPQVIVSFFAAVVLSSAISMFVSISYKISLHMMGWGTLAGVILAFALRINIELHFLLSLIIILSAIVATARLWLNEHNMQQIVSAWFGASFLSFIVMNFL